jgi:hypothetical protein
MFTYVVKYGRRTIGATSAAYVVVSVWNAPHGIPQRISPAMSIEMFWAKKRRKMAPVIMKRAPSMVFRYPNRSAKSPAIIKPKICTGSRCQ